MTDSIYNTPYVIYRHTNTITDKSYIGKTVCGIDTRWREHICSANRGLMRYFYNTIRKYGTDCWDHEILYVSFEKDDEHLYEVEVQLISDWDTYHNGYNSDVGGRGAGSGENNPMYGKTHTIETRKNISEARKRQKTSNKTKSKMSLSRRGENNHQFTGYYIYNNQKFASIQTLSDILKINRMSIRRWCRNRNNNIISSQTYGKSKFLQSIGDRIDIVGKTYGDLGFGFESI